MGSHAFSQTILGYSGTFLEGSPYLVRASKKWNGNLFINGVQQATLKARDT